MYCVVTCVDLRFCCCVLLFSKGDFWVIFSFFYARYTPPCLICRPSDSTASEDARIKPRTVTTLALTTRRLG